MVEYWNGPTPSDCRDKSYVCGCVGPQNGDPVCPCRMRAIKIQDGRYIEVIDHGPVRKECDPGKWARDYLSDGGWL